MGCLIYCITTLIVSVSLYYAYAKYKLSYWNRRGVKSPPTHLIFGNFKDCITLRKPPSKVLQEIYRSAETNDPYIGFYIFHKPMLLLRDHDLIRQILITDFEVFPNRRFGSSTQRDVLGLNSILSIHQPQWKYLRRKLTPVLKTERLKSMIPLMTECGMPMANFIENLPTVQDGWHECELKDLSSRYTTDIMASLSYGLRTNSFDEMDNAFWKNGSKIFRGLKRGIVFIIFFFIPEWIPLIEPFVKGPAKYIRKIFWESINEREKSGFKRGDMVDSMLALKNEEQNPIYKFEGDNLLAHPTSFYVAGFEATATTIAFTLYELARHPQYQAALYDEIQAHLSGRELTLDMIKEMSFLDGIITESLRLYPALPNTDRIATRDYELPGTGLVIEKGVSVYVAINAINQDPKYFSNPEDFIPLRERISMSEKKRSYESLAFGLGPRSCIGQRLGLLITKIALITILSNFSLRHESKDTSNINNAIHTFMYAADGLNIQFHKREKAINNT